MHKFKCTQLIQIFEINGSQLDTNYRLKCCSYEQLATNGDMPLVLKGVISALEFLKIKKSCGNLRSSPKIQKEFVGFGKIY